MTQKQKGNLALLATGFLFGASSPLAKTLGAYLSAFGVVGTRFLFALPFSLVSLLLGKEKIKLDNKDFGKISFFAFIFPVSVIFYTLALFYTKISLAIFSFYVSNLLSSLILGKVVHKEEFGWHKKLAFILSFAAILVFTNPFEGFVMEIGVIFGYISGIIQTIASHYQKRYSKDISEGVLALAQIIGGIIIGLGAAFLIGDFALFNLPLKALLVAIIFGIVIYLINKFLVYGFKRADIGTGTILMSSELIFGPVMAYIIFAEKLGPSEIVGGLLAVIATVLVAKK